MSTVDKEVADRIIAGEFPEDQVVKIVKYTNAWGGEAYGIIVAGQNPEMYRESDFVQDPTVYWTREGGKCS